MNLTSPNNSTQKPFWDTSEPEENFYRATLPKSVLSFLVLGVCSYYWHVGLERAFPARARGVVVSGSSQIGREKGSGDENEGREEEVVKRWIARGRVRRSSVSLCLLSLFLGFP